jgi:hypothetical protein
VHTQTADYFLTSNCLSPLLSPLISPNPVLVEAGLGLALPSPLLAAPVINTFSYAKHIIISVIHGGQNSLVRQPIQTMENYSAMKRSKLLELPPHG